MCGSRTMAASALVLCFVLAASFTLVLSADSGDGGLCVTLTLPDVDGLGALYRTKHTKLSDCLEGTLDTCHTSQAPIDILAPLLECTLYAIKDSGTLSEALKAFGDVFYLLLTAVDNDEAADFQILAKHLYGSLTICDCEGTVNVTLPYTIVGQCATDFGNLLSAIQCTPNSDYLCSVTEENYIPCLVESLVCLLKNALNDSPATAVSQVVCDLFTVVDPGVGTAGTILDDIIHRISGVLHC